MRLGGPVQETNTPEAWVRSVRDAGYRAAYSPIADNTDSALIRAYRQAAHHADIVIAEVGVWNNPLSTDNAIRQQAIALCQERLALADEIGARCCVNIAGSRGAQWDGPHPDNFTPETFDQIVETTRTIIDAVKPRRTFYTLEPMPWIFPDSPESYLELIRAIDRPHFAAHLDPVNMITSPRRYYANGAFLEACFAQLGPYIKSCHAKDIVLREALTVHLDEVRPGLGALDYTTFLRCLSKLDDVPLMLEHLPMAEYAAAADYMRGIARSPNLNL